MERVKNMEQDPSSVRPATPDDAAAIVDLHYRTWLATYPTFIDGLTEEIVKERFQFSETTGLQAHTKIARDKIENPNPNTQLFVHTSEETGQLDGCVVSGENAEGVKEIRVMYVDPETQGKGVGSQLIKAALEYAGAESNPVMLDVNVKNERAIRFYEKYGFVKLREVPESEVRPYLEEDELYIPEMQMVREPAPL